ncbi:CHAD domain-containing protein [Ideonella sp.]|uniref:CYTH and CHAD domain-containing protein n=1 Tax=Ideonella sp. TaxID=1929293 RepID=UPI002B490284|nr:CHAD domain-containing protein [Ideonella sp.]HJV71020.1 CHAD domain-containing protein [Ideonella sp.]
MFETELKFQIPPASEAAVRTALARAAPRRQRLRAIYFDTAERTLAAAGIALRLRQEGPRWVQTLKARGAHAAQRHEHNVPLAGAGRPATGVAPRPLPARHAGTPAAEAWQWALGEPIEAFDPARLQPVMATDVWRRALSVPDPAGGTVELAFDEGEIRAGAAATRVCELEYELVEGRLADLVRQAAEGVARHGLWLDTVSKAERGELLAQGRAVPAPVRFAAPALTRDADGATVWRAALASGAAMLLPNASALAAGSPDPEHVHQLRIAIRRLRCAVRELGPLVDSGGEPAWLAPLVGLFDALGAGRDEAALLADLAPRLQAAGAPTADWRSADQPAPPDPAGLVRAPAVQQALLALLVDSQAATDGLDPHATRHHLRQRLARLHAQAARAARPFETLPEAEQHRARKRVKRLRYLAEFTAALFERHAVKRYLRPLAEAQQRLGEHQDLLVALPLYRAAVPQRPEAWFAAGWLVAERQPSARRCRQALRVLAKARPFW